MSNGSTTLWKSLCHSCGATGYIFPDQIAVIKKKGKTNPLSQFVGNMHVGQDWICIRCDSKNCKISEELTGEKAGKLIKIRERETNLKAFGFVLP